MEFNVHRAPDDVSSGVMTSSGNGNKTAKVHPESTVDSQENERRQQGLFENANKGDDGGRVEKIKVQADISVLVHWVPRDDR